MVPLQGNYKSNDVSDFFLVARGGAGQTVEYLGPAHSLDPSLSIGLDNFRAGLNY